MPGRSGQLLIFRLTPCGFLCLRLEATRSSSNSSTVRPWKAAQTSWKKGTGRVALLRICAGATQLPIGRSAVRRQGVVNNDDCINWAALH